MPWSFARLIDTPTGRASVQKYIDAHSHLISNEEVLSRWEELLDLVGRIWYGAALHRDFKDQTYDAGIYLGRSSWRDPGNPFYSVAFDLMMLAYSLKGDYRVSWIVEQWPSTRPGSSTTLSSLNNKGDVMEFLFNNFRLTGAAVPPAIYQRRLEGMKGLKDLDFYWTQIDKNTFVGDGPPRVRHRVDTSSNARVIWWSHRLNTTSQPVKADEVACFRLFCDALTTPGPVSEDEAASLIVFLQRAGLQMRRAPRALLA